METAFTIHFNYIGNKPNGYLSNKSCCISRETLDLEFLIHLCFKLAGECFK